MKCSIHKHKCNLTDFNFAEMELLRANPIHTIYYTHQVFRNMSIAKHCLLNGEHSARELHPRYIALYDKFKDVIKP